MTRAHILVISLAAAAIAGAISLKACAGSSAPVAKTEAPAASSAPAAPVPTPESAPVSAAPIKLAQARPAQAAIGNWSAGTNYTLLADPQPTSVGAGKVEVVEVFWYGCGHCYALDPTLESWKANKPANIEFLRIPVVWGPTHLQHAKLFYTIQALRRPDLHTKIFDAIHRDGQMLAAQSDEEARALQLQFAKANGVTEKDFNAAYDSMSVATNVHRAQDLTSKYVVESVPLVIVNGKYSTGVSQAGGPSQLLSLINDLAASEKGR